MARLIKAEPEVITDQMLQELAELAFNKYEFDVTTDVNKLNSLYEQLKLSMNVIDDTLIEIQTLVDTNEDNLRKAHLYDDLMYNVNQIKENVENYNPYSNLHYDINHTNQVDRMKDEIMQEYKENYENIKTIEEYNKLKEKLSK